MERPARLFLCARCRVQVVLCSRCDRGNRYCGRPCWRQAREAARREAASRYQRSRRGRMAHSARARRWRQRHGGRGGGEQNVTHQGSQPTVAAAPLAAWTHDTASIGPEATAAALTPAPAPQQPVSAALWYCRRCAAPQPTWLRQGFLRHGRHGTPAGRRHDAGP
jgi:hypothetical protein